MEIRIIQNLCTLQEIIEVNYQNQYQVNSPALWVSVRSDENPGSMQLPENF